MNDVKLPILKPGELIKALEKLGFSRTRKSINSAGPGPIGRGRFSELYIF
jgi:hypothetical protein